MADLFSARVGEDILAASTAHAATDPRRLGLGPHRRELTNNPAPASPLALAAIGHGEPCPGVVCMGPTCWQRNTSRYGLRRVPLCLACVSALRGETYKREIPPSAARLMRGAA